MANCTQLVAAVWHPYAVVGPATLCRSRGTERRAAAAPISYLAHYSLLHAATEATALAIVAASSTTV